MDNFKQASKQGLRIVTTRGALSVEQLWSLTLSELDTLAVLLESAYKDSKGKSFLEKRTTKDLGIKLQFDIVLEVLQTKVEEEAALTQAREDKEHNQKIIELIAKKKDGELEGKSIKELEAMLR